MSWKGLVRGRWLLAAGLTAPMLAGAGLIGFPGSTPGHHCAITAVATALDAVSGVDLPVPDGIVAIEDDRNAILEWDAVEDQRIGGYVVYWGRQDSPMSYRALTRHRRIQLQPLEAGVIYLAQVHSLDFHGRASLPSAIVAFQHDAGRVDAWRGTMTGFFDDFNRPAGLPDERKWNVGYSGCNQPAKNGYFINSQWHVHNTVYSSSCDRAMTISRARVPVDFSDNGERTFVFDLDGVSRRDAWYIDLLPQRVDVYNYINEPGNFNPGGGLRFKQDSQRLQILFIDSDGNERILADTDDWSPWAPLDYVGRELIPNVRRSWVYKVARDRARAYVDGLLVIDTGPGAFELTLDTYHAAWNTFSYNTIKSHHHNVLVHWDNFGFDAPAGAAPPNVVHNYRLRNGGTDFIRAQRGSGSPAVVTLPIPDAVAGAVARRLMFTLQMWGFESYEWTPQDAIVVNGTAFAFPRPVTYGIEPPIQDPISGNRPLTQTIDLPEDVLVSGDNEIVFDLAKSGVHNIHVELEFVPGSEPAYTPPAVHASGAPMPTEVRIGPTIAIERIGPVDVVTWEEGLSDPARFNPTISGTAAVEARFSGYAALIGNGVDYGMSRMGLLVDGVEVQAIRTDIDVPAPSGRVRFDLDTTGLANGMHQISIYACNSRGDPHANEYGGPVYHGVGGYFPLHVTVANPGAGTGTFTPAGFDAWAACAGEAEGGDPIFANGFDGN